MRWREALHPVGMQRVALLSRRGRAARPAGRRRRRGHGGAGRRTGRTRVAGPTPAAARLQRSARPAAGRPARLAPTHARPRPLRAAGRVDLIAGEAQLEQRAGQAVTRGRVAALAGWMPADALPTGWPDWPPWAARSCPCRVRPASSRRRMLPHDGCRPGVRAAGRHLCDRARTPTSTRPLIAGLAYVVMFGMMFADVGHGALLLLAALAVRVRVVVAAGAASPGLAVPGRRRSRQHGVRRAVRRVLRPDRRRPGGLAGATGAPGDAAWSPRSPSVPCCWPARTRSARSTASARAAGGARSTPRRAWPGAALFLGLGAGGRRRLPRLGTGWPCSAGCVAAVGLGLAYVGLLASAGGGAAGPRRPASSCSTWSCGSARTWSASRGWPRSA